VATAIDAAVAIVTIGLLACVQRPTAEGVAVRPLTATEWAVVSIALGVVGGALFHLFLGTERKVDRLVVSLGGAVIFVSGAAAYLHVSPLLPSMIVGAMLANTSASRHEIAETLARGERPFYFVLLLFAGVAWAPGDRVWVVLPVLAFLAARAVGKIGGAWLGARVNAMLPVVGSQWGRALLGQGGLALALALDYLRQPGAPLTSVVFTAVVLSVLVSDLSQARLVQSVLLPLKLRASAERTAVQGSR
jgi:Kef-type K+ transport system membrane component KefB